jgi:hypothetical protein
VPAAPSLTFDRLLVQLVARDLATALSSRGCFRAPEGTVPELLIEFDFGMDGPSTVARRGREKVESLSLAGGDLEDGPVVIREYRTVLRPVPAYRKFLRLTARVPVAAADTSVAPVAWSVVVEHVDTSDDLRNDVQWMVAAAMDYVGTESGGTTIVALSARDDRVIFLRNGSKEP